MIDLDYAFVLPEHKIHPYHQDAIIEEAVKLGTVADENPVFVRHDVRVVDWEKTDIPYDGDTPPADFYYRLEPESHWKWLDNDAATILRPYVEGVAHLFHHITRVKVFLQTPGMAINAHRELVPGNHYRAIRSPLDSSYGASSGVYQGEQGVRVSENDRHKAQRYLTVKVPLTSQPGDPGRPYVVKDERVFFNTHDCLYAINEYEMAHGAEPVDFWRGVSFIDGILDMQALEWAMKWHLE